MRSISRQPQPLIERIPLPGPASVTVREFRRPAFRDPWHQHPEIELTWILQGSGLRYAGDSVEPFHAGDCCLLGANLPHTWLSSEGEGKGGVCSIVVQFDPERWGTDLLRLPEMARISDLLARAARGLHFRPEVGARLIRRMPLRASPLARFTALLGILDELAVVPDARSLCLGAWGAIGARRPDPRLRAVLAHLAAHAGGAVSQAEVARMVRLSPSAFSRYFRRAVGKTFGSYLTDLRLGEVCRQLLETDRTVSEIAFAAGFGNLSNFNRAFRSVRGMSPREFRRQSANPVR